MKKFTVVFLAVLVLCMFLLSGCNTSQVEEVEDINSTSSKKDNTSMFILIETTLDWKIVYHKETKVMYAVSAGDYNRGAFTLLVNTDGTPMVYED